jgi:hypothetical protein
MLAVMATAIGAMRVELEIQAVRFRPGAVGSMEMVREELSGVSVSVVLVVLDRRLAWR